MIRLYFILLSLVVSTFCSANVYAESADPGCTPGRGWCREQGRQCRPEHRGNCGKRRGDWYGAKRAVGSLEEARSQFAAYFTGMDVTVGNVTEKPWRFEADVTNRNGEIVDRVIIDRRSGRIRSIY